MKVLSRRRMILVNSLLLALFLVSFLGSSLVGPVSVDLREAIVGLSSGAAEADILFRARLPRVLLGLAVGGGLATVGLTLQALLRNPLACAHILGVSGGASLGGILGLIFAPQFLLSTHQQILGDISWTPLASFIGALGSVLLIYRLSLVRGRLHPYHLLLCGVIFNAFVSAVIMFLNSVLDFYQAQNLLFWLMGSLSTRSYLTVTVIWIYVLAGCLWLWRHGLSLNLMSLGEDAATQLGIDVDRTQRQLFIASSFVVGTIVSVSGMIGFVGLIVPHVMRLILGSDHRLLLPASFLAGGIFLCWADTLARTLYAPAELPVGVITAFLGGPFFFLLLHRGSANPILHEPGH